jgi:high affinity Mn2+ porin
MTELLTSYGRRFSYRAGSEPQFLGPVSLPDAKAAQMDPNPHIPLRRVPERIRSNHSAAFALAMLLLSASAAFADEPGRSGFYVGGHVGYMFGTANATLGDPTDPTLGLDWASGSSPFGTLFAGVQAGYEHFFPSRLMLGLELDMSFPDYMGLAPVMSYRATGSGTANEQLEYLATLRGRAGYSIGSWTPFFTGGLAWGSTRVSRTDLTTANEEAYPSNVRLGYAAGGGVDYRLDNRWSTRLEYLYTNLGLFGLPFASAPARYDSQYDLHRFRVALNYKFGAPDDQKEKEREANRGPGTWEIHGQTTFVYQGYPPFGAAYEGPQSLPSIGQSRDTWTTSAFLGIRLWEGGSLYYNPELLQGFGLASTFGAAGFPNGEAQKSNFPYPQYSTSRLFLRQEVGLGGEREKVDSDYGQLSGERDVSRLTFQVGRFPVHDIFDGNAYAKDPRVDFLNWSIWAAGAFDYAADKIGLTYGITAEINRPLWAARLGYFLVPTFPNDSTFNMNLFSTGGYVGELEMRYKPYDRPGSVRLGAWLNSAIMGSYDQAVALAALDPTGTLSPADTVAQTQQVRTKYGFYLNFDQEITDWLGMFGRFSWNDGRTQIIAFTDIDTSLSLGLSIKGTAWGRPDDRVGIAGAWNNISGNHSGFLAAGGLGILVGDGALTYASENIFEAYYAFQVAKGVVLTADYQFLGNVAYNMLRGPVNVLSGRLHMSF